MVINMDMQFDNHDSRIKYYELMLERDLDYLPCFPLPDGYRFVFYRPGDCSSWIEIEKSAKEFVLHTVRLPPIPGINIMKRRTSWQRRR